MKNISYDYKVDVYLYQDDKKRLNHKLYQANDLCRLGKLRGAILTYDAVLAEVSKERDWYSDHYTEYEYSALNKLAILENLYMCNGYNTVEEYKDIFELCDTYLKKIKNTRNEEYTSWAKNSALRGILGRKAYLYYKLNDYANCEQSLACYKEILEIIEKEILSDPTDGVNYYQKATILYKMDLDNESLEALAIAEEFLTDDTWIQYCNELYNKIKGINLDYSDSDY